MASDANLWGVTMAGEAVIFDQEVVDVPKTIAWANMGRLIAFVICELIEVLGCRRQQRHYRRQYHSCQTNVLHSLPVR